jgi:hypothetical protein
LIVGIKRELEMRDKLFADEGLEELVIIFYDLKN